MRRISISLDEEILSRAQRYASRNNMSLSELVAKLIDEVTMPPNAGGLNDMFVQADQNEWRSSETWARDDAQRFF